MSALNTNVMKRRRKSGSMCTANLLKDELGKAGACYDDLCVKPKTVDAEESRQCGAAKVNRGAFNFAFSMQCMKALGIKTLRFGE